MEIHYRRPHSGVTTYRQLVVDANDHWVVTFQPEAQIPGPVIVEGSSILTPGAPVIWFTIPGAWHDIGVFHLPDGSQTGVYANVLTPVQFDSPTSWSTTDLYLDVWIPASGELQLLDEAELAHAVKGGVVSAEDAFRAKSEARALMAGQREGRWPPPDIYRWNLKRARGIWARHHQDL